MSEIRCPNCNVELSAIDRVSGWCDNCGKKIPPYALAGAPLQTISDAPRLPSFESPSRPVPRPFRPSYSARTRRWMGLGFIALLVLGVAGVVLYFLLQPNVAIAVDNGGSGPMTVLLDGSETLTVPAGQVKVMSCWSGRRRITVKRGDQTVFDKTLELKGGGRRGSRKYLLNPEATNRYWVQTVHYGLNIPSFGTYFDDLDHYRQMADEIKLAPAADWIDADTDLVLEPAPEKVEAEFSDSRTVLSRIARADYDLIDAAAKKGAVTSEEVDRMEALVDRLLKSGD